MEANLERVGYYDNVRVLEIQTELQLSKHGSQTTAVIYTYSDFVVSICRLVYPAKRGVERVRVKL